MLLCLICIAVTLTLDKLVLCFYLCECFVCSGSLYVFGQGKYCISAYVVRSLLPEVGGFDRWGLYWSLPHSLINDISMVTLGFWFWFSARIYPFCSLLKIKMNYGNCASYVVFMVLWNSWLNNCSFCMAFHQPMLYFLFGISHKPYFHCRIQWVPDPWGGWV